MDAYSVLPSLSACGCPALGNAAIAAISHAPFSSSPHGKSVAVAFLFRDGFHSLDRELTVVLAYASTQHAVWRLSRNGQTTRVILPKPNSLYMLCFTASANAMALHGVERLPATNAAARLGLRERYSLSFAAAFQEAGTEAALLRALESSSRFHNIQCIPAMQPPPWDLVVGRCGKKRPLDGD